MFLSLNSQLFHCNPFLSSIRNKFYIFSTQTKLVRTYFLIKNLQRNIGIFATWTNFQSPRRKTSLVYSTFKIIRFTIKIYRRWQRSLNFHHSYTFHKSFTKFSRLNLRRGARSTTAIEKTHPVRYFQTQSWTWLHYRSVFPVFLLSQVILERQ